MARYLVTIEAIVRKTIKVEAANKDEADEVANGLFSTDVEGDGSDEEYDQQTVDIKKVRE